MGRTYIFRCWYNSGPSSNFSFPVNATTFANAIKESIPVAEKEGFKLDDLSQIRRDDGKVYMKDDLMKIIDAITKESIEP